MRQTVVRLVLIGSLLAVYPLAALVLSLRSAPPAPLPAAAVTGRIEPAGESDGSTLYEVHVTVTAAAGPPRSIEQVMLTAMHADQTLSTVIEDHAALVLRGGRLDAPPGVTREVGPFRLAVPRGARLDAVLAAVRLSGTGPTGPQMVQGELAPPGH